MSAKLFLHLSFFLFFSVHANFLLFCPYFFLPIFCPAKKSKALRTFTNREMVIFYPPPPSLFPFITFSSLSLFIFYPHISLTTPICIYVYPSLNTSHPNSTSSYLFFTVPTYPSDSFFLKKWANPGLFFVYSRSFQETLQFYNKYM